MQLYYEPLCCNWDLLWPSTGPGACDGAETGAAGLPVEEFGQHSLSGYDCLARFWRAGWGTEIIDGVDQPGTQRHWGATCCTWRPCCCKPVSLQAKDVLLSRSTEPLSCQKTCASLLHAHLSCAGAAAKSLKLYTPSRPGKQRHRNAFPYPFLRKLLSVRRCRVWQRYTIIVTQDSFS